MESESIQIARIFKYPTWAEHYREFLPDSLEGMTQPANQLLLSLASKLSDQRKNQTPDEFLDFCLEASLTWTGEENAVRGGKIPAGKVLQKSATIRELINKIEDPIRAEQNFRNWLQRTITCNATTAEPVLKNDGSLTDPFFKASEKLAILGAKRLLAEGEKEEIFFPLSSTRLEYRPRMPIGLDIFDQDEWDGGPEFDTVLTLSGESNVGKTMLGLYIMSCLASCRKNLLIISGEDSKEENRKRILCHHLRSTPSEIAAMSEKDRTARMIQFYGDPEDPESLHHHLQTRMASVCAEEGRITPAYIRERVDKLEQTIGAPVNAVMLDYLQKAKPDGNTQRMQRDEELEVFVNQLKEDGEDKRLSLLISQVPSNAAGGKTEFLGIKEATARSYAATWGAHYIVTMNRTIEETERLRASTDKRPRINLFLCKNKNGPIGTCYGLGYPREARWRFFRSKPEMLRAVENDTPTRHSP